MRLGNRLAQLVCAYQNCVNSGNVAWEDKHKERIDSLCDDHLPSGSGFDSGSSIDIDLSNDNKLVFNTSFHHVDEHGYYDGWTEHTVIITPSLAHEFNIRVTGRNKRDIKDYISECFSELLYREVI